MANSIWPQQVTSAYARDGFRDFSQLTRETTQLAHCTAPNQDPDFFISVEGGAGQVVRARQPDLPTGATRNEDLGVEAWVDPKVAVSSAPRRPTRDHLSG